MNTHVSKCKNEKIKLKKKTIVTQKIYTYLIFTIPFFSLSGPGYRKAFLFTPFLSIGLELILYNKNMESMLKPIFPAIHSLQERNKGGILANTIFKLAVK
jgi:hypothetical protein